MIGRLHSERLLAISADIAAAGEFAKLGRVFSTVHDEIAVSLDEPSRSAVDSLGDLAREARDLPGDG